MRSSLFFVLLATSAVISMPTRAADDVQPAEAAAERGELVTQATAERAKKLKRKAKKALQFVYGMDRHMDHRIVTINTDVLQRLDPLPDKPEKGTDDPKVALAFEMIFSPTESESYVLKNEKNYRSDFMGLPIVMWQGVIESTEGEVLGEYMLSDSNGKFDVSGFGFPDADFGWGFRDIEGHPKPPGANIKSP